MKDSYEEQAMLYYLRANNSFPNMFVSLLVFSISSSVSSLVLCFYYDNISHQNICRSNFINVSASVREDKNNNENNFVDKEQWTQVKSPIREETYFVIYIYIYLFCYIYIYIYKATASCGMTL